MSKISMPSHIPSDWRLFGAYRLLLAILVVTSHSSDFLPSWVTPLALGNAGVFSFFVLSGFVISEACDRFYLGAPQRFLLNRFLRLYPTYWAACVLALVIYSHIGHAQLSFTVGAILANLGIVYVPPGTFLWVSVIWAVGIEIRYYLLAAAVSWLTVQLPSRANLLYGFAGIGALSLYGFTWLKDFGSLATFRHAPFFVLGACAYFAIAKASKKAAYLGAVAALLSIHSYWLYNANGHTDLNASTMIFVIMLIAMMLLALFAIRSHRLAVVDKLFGDFTYPLYLIHFPIVALVLSYAEKPSIKHYLLIVSASLCASGILIVAIEHPLRKLRDLIRRRQLYG